MAQHHIDQNPQVNIGRAWSSPQSGDGRLAVGTFPTSIR
jgi:hypothetical protein